MLLESRLIKGKTRNYLISPDGVLITLADPPKRPKSLTHKYVMCSGYKKYSMDYAHRLVAKYFVPNPENLPEVNHEDGNKLNNHFSNLKWVTDKDNKEHSHKVLGPQGKGHSKESFKKRSQSHKKYQESLTPEQRRERTSIMQTPENKAKKLESQKKWWAGVSDEYRRERVKKLTKGTTLACSKPVVMFKDGLPVKYFSSCVEAERETGIWDISKKCRGLVQNKDKSITFKFGITG